jgi:formate hydrogenlyase subunit 3/multisubunit Na+/H+ antiporter MnhD subunit
MSYIPSNPSTIGIQSSLLGVGAQPKIIDERLDNTQLHGAVASKTSSNMHVVLIIVLSALIFVTAVALFGVIRGFLDLYFSTLSLNDKRSHNTQQDIDRTIIADNYALMAIIVFAIICVLLLFLLTPLIFYLLDKYK